MTNKQKIQSLVDRMPDDIPFERAVYQMFVLQKVEAGLADMHAGRLIDHDELFDELLKDEEASKPALDRKRKKRSAAAKGAHLARQSSNGRRLRKTAKAVGP